MTRNAAQRRGAGWLKLVGLGLAVTVGLAAAAIIVPPMLLEPATDVALIKAQGVPFKVKPQDPGGVKIPHAETTVMGMIDDLGQPEEATEVMRPPSAVPEMPPTPVEKTKDVAMAADPQPVAPGAGGGSAEAPADVSVAAASPADRGTDNATVATAADETMAEGTADPKADAAPAMPQTKPTPPKRVVVEGDEPLYVVQLAAFRKADTAREQAGLLAGKHKARLDGAELGTMRTDAGDDGVFWRVVTEPMARADADKVCAALKRAGQDCILRKYVVDG